MHTTTNGPSASVVRRGPVRCGARIGDAGEGLLCGRQRTRQPRATGDGVGKLWLARGTREDAVAGLVCAALDDGDVTYALGLPHSTYFMGLAVLDDKNADGSPRFAIVIAP